MSAKSEDGSTPSDRDTVALIVLAAGAGTRMKSSLPKPLHSVAGMPMLWHVLTAGSAADPLARIVVVSPEIAAHPAWESARVDAELAVQDPPLGTAHAVRSALGAVPEVEWLLVLFADHPLLTGETVIRLIDRARTTRTLVTILSCVLSDPGAYARIERDQHARVTRIVERKDDNEALRMGQVEINSGMMVIDAVWARGALERITPSAVTGEFYLPELVRLAVEEHRNDNSWPVQSVSGAVEDLLGVNDRIELAQADDIARRRIKETHQTAGVSLVMPQTIVIDAGVSIGMDTTILPGSAIGSGACIGRRCVIGPYAVIDGDHIGDGAVVRGSFWGRSSAGDQRELFTNGRGIEGNS
jgi:bifunctional UDP-N-acetylglucosamine pyrophosphorylase/glucosamine-1-phosphate N-acetyltransferase